MKPRIGSMFSGYGGLDLAIAEALGGETVFVADVCKVDKDGNVGHYEPASPGTKCSKPAAAASYPSRRSQRSSGSASWPSWEAAA